MSDMNIASSIAVAEFKAKGKLLTHRSLRVFSDTLVILAYPVVAS